MESKEIAVFKGGKLIEHLDGAFLGDNIKFDVNDVWFDGVLEKGQNTATANSYGVKDVTFFIEKDKSYECSYLRGRMSIKEVL